MEEGARFDLNLIPEPKQDMKLLSILKGQLAVVLALCLLACTCARSTERACEGMPIFFQHLEQKELLELTLTFDLSALAEASDEVEARYAAQLVFEQEGQPPVAHDIEVYARGNMRKRYCDFPPLKLCFAREALCAAGFSGSSNLKLVTHCQEQGDPFLLKEYLAYLLYNEMTEYSFQVQLARIHYVDSQRDRPEEVHYAFLIEPKKDLAKRLGVEIVNLSEAPKGIKAEAYRRLVFFQYMIGNTDWGMHGHNIQMVRQPGESMPIPVPYDFDQSGLVGAPYALPHPKLPISKVGERLFQWRGGPPKGFNATIQEFRDKKPRLQHLISSFEYLDSGERQAMLAYLEEFFEIIAPEREDEQWPMVLNSVF
jgi:hypothetical protein